MAARMTVTAAAITTIKIIAAIAVIIVTKMIVTAAAITITRMIAAIAVTIVTKTIVAAAATIPDLNRDLTQDLSATEKPAAVKRRIIKQNGHSYFMSALLVS